MKKISKIWNENKILIVLAIILIVCILVIGIVSVVYFYGSSGSVYGNRLDVTKEVPIEKNDLQNFESKFTENEAITSANAVKKGKIIYLNIKFIDGTSLDSAKSIVNEIVNKFDEKILATYDFQLTISSSLTDAVEGFNLIGARNANGSQSVVWSNNTKVEEGSNE